MAARSAGATAVRIAGLYALVGAVWIVASDLLVADIPLPGSHSLPLNIAKGCAYVLITAILLYSLVARELAARERVEQSLQQQNQLLRHIMETSPIAICVFGADGRVTLANARAESVLGLTRDKITGRTYNDPEWHITAHGGGPFRDEDLPFRHVQATGRPVQGVEHAIEWSDGRRVLLSVSAAPLVGSRGELSGVVTVFDDVTERRGTRHALERSLRAARVKGDLTALLIAEPDEAALLRDACRIVTDVGGYRLCWIGYAADDEAGTVDPVRSCGADDGYTASLGVALRGGPKAHGPTATAIRTGQPAVAKDLAADPLFAPWRGAALARGFGSSAAFPMDIGEGHRGALNVYAPEPDAFDGDEVALLADFARLLAHGVRVRRERVAHRKTGLALQQSEDAYRELVESANSVILRLDREGRITFFNRFAQEFFGYAEEEIIGQPCVGTIVPETETSGRDLRALIEGILADPDAYAVNENENVTKDGRRVWVTWTNRAIVQDGEVVGLMGIGNDITERHRLEERMRQAAKMDAIGVLAGGVAHDFNNTLTGIIGYTEITLAEAHLPSEVRDDISQVRDLARHAADLTRQLLAFSRQQTIAPVPADLNELTVRLLRMLRRLIGEDIEVRFDPATDLPMCRVDPGQIEQVLVNLAVNARDAMPGGGSLTIRTAHRAVSAAEAAQHVGLTRGPYVIVSVRDTGSGMDLPTQLRIFEPFYTTKELGRGTGLGLSVVHGIVTQHGGHITVDSEPGEGTTFTVYLPAIGEEEGCAGGEAAPQPATLPGGATILLVEDDPQVRQVVRRILDALGYEVLEASGVSEGERVFGQHRARISLLLTDVVMQDGTGPELCSRLRAVAPELRTVLMSGHTSHPAVDAVALPDGVPLLRKPFTPHALARALHDALS